MNNEYNERNLHGGELRDDVDAGSELILDQTASWKVKRRSRKVASHQGVTIIACFYAGSYSYRANLLATASSGTVTYATECIPARLDMF